MIDDLFRILVITNLMILEGRRYQIKGNRSISSLIYILRYVTSLLDSTWIVIQRRKWPFDFHTIIFLMDITRGIEIVNMISGGLGRSLPVMRPNSTAWAISLGSVVWYHTRNMPHTN